MRIFYWLKLLSFLSSLACLGLFRNSLSYGPILAADRARHSVHPFMRGDKIELSRATVLELSSVSGISLSKARRIKAFIEKNPRATFTDLLLIDGIGPKSLIKLEEYFLLTGGQSPQRAPPP